MFYSRPNLPQLGIDLVEVKGGLGRPSQYWGRASDGRAISLRYDNGFITVSVGDDRHQLKEDLLCVGIGPMFNGDMLLEQICDLTGITVGGEKLALSEEKWREAAEKDSILDWSGRTTYWIRNVLLTKEGGLRLAKELAFAFPGMHILEVDWVWGPARRIYIPRKRISECENSALFGFGADESRLASMLSRDHVTLAELDEAFAHHLTLRFRWNDQPRRSYAEKLAAKYRRNIIEPDVELLSHLDTKFATGDALGETHARQMIDVVRACFSEWVEDVDIATGEAVGAPRQINWYGNDLRDWCLAARDRFLRCRLKKDELERDIAIRPCHAPV